MTRPFGALRAACALMLLSGLLGNPAVAAGQSVLDAVEADTPAHIAFVEGSAVLERDGRPDNSPANMPLLAGDRVRTQAGRVEILFADGSTLHLDANTTVDFQSDELVRLLDGRVRLAIPGPDRDVSYRVDAPSAWAQITQPGEYRVAILRGDREPEVELAVIRGTAELVNEGGRTALRAGERAFSRANAAPSYAYAFNSATWDEFDRWSESRRDERRGVSAQYLPNEVRPYSASFDRYGSWQHEASYGYVWYPTVSAGWRPYYHGRWATLRPYGWTWIGSDPWAWPTHHLRALGLLRRALVLDSRTQLGAGVGVVGLRAGLRELVSARLEQPADLRRELLRGRTQSLARVDGRAAPSFRSRLRQRQGCSRRSVRRAHTRVVRRAEHGAREPRVRRAARVRADSHRRHPVDPARIVSGLHEPGARGLARRLRAVTHHGRAVQKFGGGAVTRTIARRASRECDRVRRPGRRRRQQRRFLRTVARRASRGGDRVWRPGRQRRQREAGRSRAVPRGGATEYGVPGATDSRSRSAYSGQSPSTAPPSQERYAPADRGPRAIPRADSAYRGSVSPSQRQPDSTIQRSDPPAGSRAVPRSGDSAPPNYRRDSYEPRSPEPDRGPSRAMPRSAPESSRPSAPEYRQSPPSRSGGDAARSAPAPSSDRPSGSSAGSSRPRSGGQSSSGTAQPRGGGRR